MVAQLVTRNFRHASGTPAKFKTVMVTARGSSTALQTLTTDQTGFVSTYLEPGQYDWLVDDYRTPFDVTAPVTVSPSPPFIHTQSTPAATWTIPHNRGTKPDLVITLDTEPESRVYTDVTYPDLNTAVVELPSASTGKAYIP